VVRLAILALVATALVAGSLVVWRPASFEDALARVPWNDEFRLADRVEVRETVQDLSTTFGPDAVSAQNADAPVRVGVVRAGPDERVRGGARQAIVAPVPARLGFRVAVPPEAALQFAIGTEDVARRGGAVRFAVTVDGAEVFARVLDPATHQHDSGWFEQEVLLGAFGGRQVDLGLVTARADEGSERTATPAWSHVHVVRRTERARQLYAAATPNVLLLVIDTLRADRTGPYGARPSPTPNLDRLAAAGVVFEDAVAQAPWTMLSVPSILTGLHPRSHGAWGNVATDGRVDHAFLDDSIETLADAARREGITTFAVSTNPVVSRGTNMLKGFETTVEYGMERRFHPERTSPTWARASQVHHTFRRWLARNRGYRFFAYLHYMEPHRPYTPPADLRPPVPPGVRPEVANGAVYEIAQDILRGGPPLPPHDVDYLRALYDAEVRSWDRELPQLLDTLERFGVRDSTLIVVTADHGEEFQEHGRLRHGPHLYEETIRVPLVIVGPGVRPGRSTVQAQGIDVFPTLAHVLGFRARRRLPGQDLFAAPAARAAFSETGNGGEGHLIAVRRDGWKLIHAPALDRWELYDLSRDAGEHENRAGSAPEHAALVTLLRGWERTTPAAPAPDGRDGGLIETLRSLGYVE
jgi:arylsulfatase A-like enzyme